MPVILLQLILIMLCTSIEHSALLNNKLLINSDAKLMRPNFLLLGSLKYCTSMNTSKSVRRNCFQKDRKWRVE